MKSVLKKSYLICLMLVLISSFDIHAQKSKVSNQDSFIKSLSDFIDKNFSGLPAPLNEGIYLNSFTLSNKGGEYTLNLVYLFTNEYFYDDYYYELTVELSNGFMSEIIKSLGFKTEAYLKHNIDLNIKILSSDKKLLFSKVITNDKYIEYYFHNKNSNIYSAKTHDMSYMHQLVDYLNKDNPTEIEDGMILQNIVLEDRTWVYNIYLRNDLSVLYMLELMDDEEKTKQEIKKSLIEEKKMSFTKKIVQELSDLGIIFDYRYYDKDTNKLIFNITFSMDEILN